MTLTLFPLSRGLICWSLTAIISATLAAILMGPSQHLDLPNSLTLMAIGTAIMGISA